MDKKGFFVQAGLLEEHQFEALIQSANINIDKINNKILVTLIFESIPNYSLISQLEKNKTNDLIKNSLQIIYRIRELKDTDKELSTYINKFVEDNNLSTNLIVTNALSTYIIDNDKLYIEYFSDTQKGMLNQYLNKLLNFLKALGLDFISVELKYVENKDAEARIKKNVETIKNAKPIYAAIKTKTIEDFNKLNSGIVREKVTTIKQVQAINDPEDIKQLTIEGEIFHIVKPEKSGGWEIYIKDHTGAMAARVWPSEEGTKTASGWVMPNNRPVEFLSLLKKGDFVKLKGKYDYKKGTQILSFSAYNIYVDTTKKHVDKYDTAIKPRIEVLAHTKFTSADGLNTASDIVKYSINSKMPAIGFCDRGNVQGYPDIDNACTLKKSKNDEVQNEYKQKALYGYEVSVLNKQIDFCINATANSGDLKTQEYVVFDLETTGLFNEDEDIIEFGGIRVKDGNVIDRLDILIKPTKPVPSFISELTHITNYILADKKSFSEEIDRILEFIGDSVLIAHNGINFDIRFLNKKLTQLGRAPVKNILIDTMQISKALHPSYPRHRLGYICRQNKIMYDDSIAHRADFDAEVLFAVWKIHMNELKELGITKISELNEKLLSKEIYRLTYPMYMNIYAKNKTGLKQLYKLVSLSLTDQFYREKPTLFREQLQEYRENLIICNNPYEGDLWDIACNGTDEELNKEIKFYDYIFIAPKHCLNHLINDGKISEETIEKVINKIIKFASLNNKKVIATSSMYYLYKDMYEAHNVFIYNKLVGGHNHRFLTHSLEKLTPPLFYCLTTEEMLKALDFIKDKQLLEDIVINNTYEFADLFQKNQILLNTLYTPEIAGVDDMLRNLVEKTLLDIYGDNVLPLIRERVNKELDIIIGKGFAVIYWISHLLVKKSNDNGYVVGSRGSVGSSFVAMLAKISEVNSLPPHYVCPKCKHHEFFEDITVDGFDLPIKMCPVCGSKMKSDGHNIPFESFLGTVGAPKVPDVDLNFSGEYQGEAHKFISEMFGRNNAFRAGTVTTVAEKTAFGYVKKYFEEIADTERLNNTAEISYLQNNVVDNKRNNGLHAGGMIVIPATHLGKPLDIHDFCPYSLPPTAEEGEENQGWFATHFDFHAIHDNVLKFDILGHDIPTQFKQIRDTSGIGTDAVDFQDHKVLQLFENLEPLGITPEQINGETIGTYALPECATNFTLGMIKESKPRVFGDLIRISGLSHGTDVWIGNARQLVLKEGKQLREVVSFREDMLEFLGNNGVNPDDAFSFAELVRKGKQKDPKFELLLVKLREKNIPEWYIESCRKIRYLFPKAHATAYMTQAYIAGWYKIYHPLDFYAAWFSCKPSEFDLETITKDSKTMMEKINDIEKRLANKETKISVSAKEEALIDTYKVALEACARGIKIANINLKTSEAKKFIIDREHNCLIPPFRALAGLGEAVAESIISERNKKPFESKEDLMSRTKINKNHFKQLVDLGALNDLSDTAQMSLNEFFD